MSNEKDIPKLNDKQMRFCEEYCIDLDRNRAYRAAYASEKTDASVRTLAGKMLTNVDILKYIAELKADTALAVGVSKAMVARELKRLAFSNMSDFNKSWTEHKDWDSLTEDQKAAISEIIHTKTTFGEDCEKTIVKFKLHDKLGAIEKLNKMLGFNEPEGLTINGNQGITLNFRPSKVKLPSSESEVINNQKE